MGAGQGNLKLRDMDVTNLELRMGAGQVQLDLTGPRKSDLNVTVKGGVGQATIRLPKDVGVSAHAAGGIGAVRTEGLNNNGGEYRNDVYGKTPHKITLDVQGGIGEIELLQEP
jgi:predicted membrane protein